jgi:hypothetical protein
MPAGGSRTSWNWPAFLRKPRLLKAFSPTARQGLLIQVSLLVIVMWAMLASWGSNPRYRQKGIRLLANEGFSKLNKTGDEPLLASMPDSLEPNDLGVPMPEPDLKPEPTVLIPVAGSAAAPEPLPSLTAPSLNLNSFPAPEMSWDLGYSLPNSHRGDSPMISNWKMLGLETLLAGALAAAPAFPADTDTGKAPDLAAISKQIDEIKKAMLTADVFKVSDEAIHKELAELRGKGINLDLKLVKSQEDIDALKKQLAQMQLDIDNLKNRPTSQVSGYAPVPASQGYGQLRLINTYYDPMTIFVNGRAYVVRPNETRITEPIAAGAFTYAVANVQGERTRNLIANETFTINIHPQY